MGTIDKSQWDNLASKLKGYNTLHANNLKDNGCAMRKAFNNMNEDTKQAIADSFDSKLDLALQDELMDIKKKLGLGKYTQFLSNPKAVEALKEAGIAVSAVDKEGNVVDNPKASHRDWVVSRVDEDGKVIQDENGKLAQFKWKDFNSDSYIQTAEAYVNDLLKTAGYDCVSHLDYTDAELSEMRNLKGTSSNVDARSSVGSFGSGSTKSSGGEGGSSGGTLGLGGTADAGTLASIGGSQDQGSGKQGITREKFDQMVKNLMEKKGCTKSMAEQKLLKEYEITSQLSVA